MAHLFVQPCPRLFLLPSMPRPPLAKLDTFTDKLAACLKRLGLLSVSDKRIQKVFDTGEVLVHLGVKTIIVILMNWVVAIENRIEIAVIPIIQFDFVIEFRTMGYGCSLN